MSSAPPLLSAAAGTGGRQSRSASKAVVRAASGFHVFRIEGYSLTAKTIPGGEKISSPDFTVGGRRWRIDVYPNGADSYGDELESNSMALYLVYRGEKAGDYGGRVGVADGEHQPLRRVAAEYRFSLLDQAGDAAYELPAAKGVFRRSRSGGSDRRRRGHDAFISKDELERRRERLILRDDCLVVRCDVGVIDQLWVQSIAVGDGAKRRRRRRSARHDDAGADTGSSCSTDDTDSESWSGSSSADDSCSDEAESDDDSPSRRRDKRRRRRREMTRLFEEECMLRCFES